jgi:hypothetical protein
MKTAVALEARATQHKRTLVSVQKCLENKSELLCSYINVRDVSFYTERSYDASSWEW